VDSKTEELELSIDDTNKLRAKLGLKPLRVDDESGQSKSSSRSEVHKPATNDGETKELKDRLEKARLERDVQKGIETKFDSSTLAEDAEGSALSWAVKMRKSQTSEATNKKSSKKKKKKNKSGISKNPVNYDEADLEGLHVSHAASDFEAGSTTILTLADAPLLKTQENSTKVVGLNNETQQTLQNVELANQQAQEDGLKKKRQLELGMGRAGGYAGFDDDEFEELGGSQGPSRLARGQQQQQKQDPSESGRRGFTLDAKGTVGNTEESKSGGDLFAHQSGLAISLEATSADVMATDFLTAEEDAALQKKKKKKEPKFKKKKKKEKKNRRKVNEEEEEEDEADAKQQTTPKTEISLLQELEQTAVTETGTSRKRRRRSEDDDGEEEEPEKGKQPRLFTEDEPAKADKPSEDVSKRAKYDSIMEKGNERTARAFKVSVMKKDNKAEGPPPVDEEPDDEFLNAALAKARRLRRLRQMSQATTKGADAVVAAVQSSGAAGVKVEEESAKSGVVQFAIDETREFTRAMRARAEQQERKKARKATSKGEGPPAIKQETKVETVKEEDAMEIDTKDLSELAKEELKDEEDDTGFDGATASTVSVGLGLSNALTLLRQTGELSGKNAGREELRGRAKDERTYDDYEPLDLSRVVRIGPNATDKDRELASREIKLDYRDEYGRLLTRKEAYRNLCYQFHGHGSSKRKEEKKLQQIERERAEARLASRQLGGGSLGALKATQKATKKAFVVHKT